MSQITDGLVNDGDTGHFSISYESSLSPADGRTVAQGLMNVIEGDLALMREWFAGVAFRYAFPIGVELHNASDGASWQTPPDIAAPTYHPTVVIKGVKGAEQGEAEQGLDYVRYLLVSEVTEMYMNSIDNGWSENSTLFTTGDEGSKGEGLSRFLGHQFMLANNIAGPYSDYDVVNLWLPSATRPNYVEGSPDDHSQDIVTGGTTCFLYYLHDQLGFSIPSIIAAGSTTLAGVYQKLTGRTDAWASFISLVNTHYPVGTSASDMSGDTIFPVANLEALSAGVSVVAGQSAQLYLSLDRATPVSVTVALTSDNPAILTVPASVTILNGQQDCEVWVTALPVAGDPPLVTVHATYAGASVSASVRVRPHPSVLGGAVTNSATGAPLANAVVLVDGKPGMTSPSHVYMQLNTAPDGSWTTGQIAPDTYHLEVSASGYVTVTTSVVVGEGVPSTRWDVALTASLPFTVRGSVKDQSGAALSGVALTFIDDGGDLRLTTTTVSDGTYGFTQDPGMYIGGYTLFAQLDGHTPFQLRIPMIVNGATVLQNITLAVLGVLTGLINDANGAVPVAAARVSAGAEAATSDATGRYSLQLAPGSVSVHVAAIGYEFATASVTVAPAGTTEQNFTLVEASATLTGVVLDGNTGLGVGHAFVQVEGAASVQASPDGLYTFLRVPAGPSHVVARAQGYRTETVPVQIVAHDTVSKDIYLAASGTNPHPPAIA